MDYFNTLLEEIKLEILTRLPSESVLDSKLVCTNWRKIIFNHPSFSKMHLNHHLNHPSSEYAGKLGFLVLTGRDFRLHYLEYNNNHDQSSNPIQKIRRLNFTPPFNHFLFIGSYNGLICLRDCTHKSVCIWNPITRECVMLPEINRDFDTDGYSYENSGFGYVSSTNEYKVVEFYKSEMHLEVHVYTLGSGNGWRNLGKFNCGCRICLQHKVFFVNGALYWLDDILQLIGIFNLAEEKFCEHLSPPPFTPTDGCFLSTIGVLEGCLFFALEDVDGFYDIWLLKTKNNNLEKEGGEKHQLLVWNKEFRNKGMNLLAVMKSDGILTISDHYYITLYDTKTSTSKSLVKFHSYILQVSPHKNTLVSLKELGEEDTKTMESAEIEETKSSKQLQEDSDPEYIYL